MNRLVRGAFRRLGYQLYKTGDTTGFDPVMDDLFKDIHGECHEFTMTRVRPMYALYKAVEYVHKHSIPGEMVECGVWRGGSSMVMVSTLKRLGSTDRSIYLFDTFEGMSEPTENDVEFASGQSATEVWATCQDRSDKWMHGPLEEVKKNMGSTGYPSDRVVFVKGKVEETIPQAAPKQIAILRLDTDWFESTYHELTHLFPRLSKNGVLIIDDYGAWKGAREATDRYFDEQKTQILLNPIGSTVALGIKP